MRRGDESSVDEPVMVASGATLPVAVSALPKRRIEVDVDTYNLPVDEVVVVDPPPGRKGETHPEISKTAVIASTAIIRAIEFVLTSL